MLSRRGFPASMERDRSIQILADSIDPQRSPTFRSGKVGGWRSQFSPENKALFKEVAGDLLVGWDTSITRNGKSFLWLDPVGNAPQPHLHMELIENMTDLTNYQAIRLPHG